MTSALKKAYQWFAPEAEKEEDGRDKWPSRTAFVLAAMVSFILCIPFMNGFYFYAVYILICIYRVCWATLWVHIV